MFHELPTYAYRQKARPEQKIDAAVIADHSDGRCMAAMPRVSVYETRGLDFIEFGRS